MTAVDYSGQAIYTLSKIIQWKYRQFAFPKYYALFGALHIEKELLIGNGHLVAGTGLDEILGDTSIDTLLYKLPQWTQTISIKPGTPYSCLLC